MDIFNNNAFSSIALTAAIQRQPYVPQLLGSMPGLFTSNPIRTRGFFVERQSTGLRLIPASADGAPPAQLDGTGRDLVALRTSRLAKGFTLYAHELDGIRAFGSETELMQVQREYMTRAGRVQTDMELTHEHMRLGALQGLVLDADGTTVLYDYSDVFNEAIPAAISYELDVTDTDVLKIEKDLARSMWRSGQGNLAGASIHALAGDEFYDALVSHPSLQKFYLNQVAAQAQANREGQVFDSFRSPSGITYHNYRGTDDMSTVAVPATEAKFFPVGARDVFSVAWSPLESMDFVNTPGQPTYMLNITDEKRNFWAQGELYSYPAYVCQQPGVLRRATLT
jgi:hypothetical protein